MANLSSLIHELRERITASPSTPPSKEDDEALNTRFRVVIPKLVDDYVVPSSTANEREVIAVLNLLNHIAKNFPGVFYHGKPSSVLPVIGRILPFFAEPAFRSRHGVVFETMGSYISLLRTGDRDAYRQFFVDIMLVVKDVVYVASCCRDTLGKVRLKCLSGSYSGLSNEQTLPTDLPDCKSTAGHTGVFIDLTGKQRWLPFATWIIKLICKCFTDGTLYVEGLINITFFSHIFTLMCYGDADLHMACFDFARIARTVIDYEVVPSERLIHSIVAILDEDEEGIPSFRNRAYDSTMGGCLHAVHSSCADDIVKLTAEDLIAVFPQAMLRTESPELKAALCSAYVRIAKNCSVHVWRPESLLRLLCSSNVSMELIDCLQAALPMIFPDIVPKPRNNDGDQHLSVSDPTQSRISKGEGKRPFHGTDILKIKRQKIHQEVKASNDNFENVLKSTNRFAPQREEEYADYMRKSLASLVAFLNPPVDKTNLVITPEVTLTALSILGISFSIYPQVNISHGIFTQIYAWIPWMCEQAIERSSITFDLCVFLEAVNNILLNRSFLSEEEKNFWTMGNEKDFMPLLRLPWTHTLAICDPYYMRKTKSLALLVLSKMGGLSECGDDLDILDMSLKDEDEEVRKEAISSLPVILLWSGFSLMTRIFRILK